MKIYLGKSGLNQTWQDDFPKTTECFKCGSNARVMFVGIENDEGEFVCNLHKNKKGKFWPHDAISIASYLCENCFEVTSIINQA